MDSATTATRSMKLWNSLFVRTMDHSISLIASVNSLFHVIKATNGRQTSRPSSKSFVLLHIYRVKKWCKACRKRARLSRKEQIKQMDEELFRE
jgi:hypothetical protein